jgi:hypothetical protein
MTLIIMMLPFKMMTDFMTKRLNVRTVIQSDRVVRPRRVSAISDSAKPYCSDFDFEVSRDFPNDLFRFCVSENDLKLFRVHLSFSLIEVHLCSVSVYRCRNKRDDNRVV